MPGATLASEDAFAGAALDPAELLDVDMHKLTRPRALIANRLLKPEAPELGCGRVG